MYIFMEGQSGQKDHFLILINHVLILINHLLILINHLLILINHLLILVNALFVHFGLPYILHIPAAPPYFKMAESGLFCILLP